MSNRYKGGVISATPPTTTGGEDGTASGAWTLEQQMQLQAAGLWPAQPTGPYIEQVFSTYLYTGNGSTQTINNGIDLAGKGGLVWIKSRAGTYVREHYLYDTARGTILSLSTDTTGGNLNNSPNGVTAFNSDGFTALGPLGAGLTASGTTYASWTFRKQPKFFDVVTYSGSSSTQNIAHNLGSVPGCIIVKRTSGAEDWFVYHTSLGNTQYIKLNTTGAVASGFAAWNNTSPTSTQFTVLGGRTEVNAAGSTYVAYLFAHNAGGFGLTGTDNVISCGSFTTDASGNFSVNLGYEPQWVMIKSTNNTGVSAAQQNWIIMDSMRGLLTQSGNGSRLRANTAEAESGTNDFGPTATGFESLGNMSASAPFIYIAIRRGPMKVPTSGTSVFAPVIYTGDNTSTKQLTSGFPIDLIIGGDRSSPPSNVFDRLRGVSSASPVSYTASTADEQSSVYGILGMTYLQTGDGTVRYQNSTGVNYVDWFFRRAPSFFDEVCYTGDGTSNSSVNHNLGVVPELFFVKRRNAGGSGDVNWGVYSKDRPSIAFNLILNSNTGWYNAGTNGWFGTGTLSSTLFPSGNASANFGNLSGGTYVAYLFATCAGVSKVGSYTGTGTTKQIDCGFTGGARFVLIKRTDSTGDWYVWDSARGIVAGNDPYLLLNSTAAEVTNTDYVDTYSAGFEISSTAPAAINANGGTFIFLAIA